MLLLRRKRDLQAAYDDLFKLLQDLIRSYERSPVTSSDTSRAPINRATEAIVRISTRQKLVNRCLYLLGRDCDGKPLESSENVKNDETNDPTVNGNNKKRLQKEFWESALSSQILVHSANFIWTMKARNCTSCGSFISGTVFHDIRELPHAVNQQNS